MTVDYSAVWAPHANPQGHVPCPTCGGIGSVIDHDATYDPFAWVPSLEWVPHVEEVPCPTCRASGVVEVTQ